MCAEELSVLALSKNGHFFIFEFALDEPWTTFFQDGVCIHIKIAAFQRVDTLSDFLAGHVFAFALIEQELVEYRLEPIDELDLFEESFELIDSHHRNRDNFLVLLRTAALVLVVSAVSHFEEIGEELCHFLTDEEVTEYVDLVMGPNFIEGFHKFVRVLAQIVERQYLFRDIIVDEDLQILSDVAVDLNFLLSGRFHLLSEIVNIAG